MRIAVIADVLGEENNGTSITVKRLILNLKKRGHEVLVVAPGDKGKRGTMPWTRSISRSSTITSAKTA